MTSLAYQTIADVPEVVVDNCQRKPRSSSNARLVSAMDWEDGRWFIARWHQEEWSEKEAKAIDLLHYPQRYLGRNSIVIVEATHLDPRVNSKAQVYPLPLLRKLEHNFTKLGIEVRRYSQRKTKRYEAYALENECKEDGTRNKRFDYRFLLRYSLTEGIPTRSWHAPTNRDIEEWKSRDKLRAEAKYILNLGRLCSYKIGDPLTPDRRIDNVLWHAQEILLTKFHELDQDLIDFYKLQPRRDGRAGLVGANWSRVLSAYALVYDIECGRRVPVEQFSARHLASAIAGLHEHGYPFQVRATLVRERSGSLADERKMFLRLLHAFAR